MADFISAYTGIQIDTHIGDDTKHRVINDAGTLTTELLSASKIIADLATKSNTAHNHTGVYEPADSDIVKAPLGVLPMLDGSNLTGLPSGVTDHGSLTGLVDDDHTQYHNDARGDARYLPLTGGTMTGVITEAVAVMASDVLEPDNGTIQTRTLTANTTLTDGLANGQSMTLIVTSGGFTLTFPTTTFWAGSAPTLQTTDRLFLEKIGSTLYCSHTGSIA